MQVLVKVCRDMVRTKKDRDANFWQTQVNKNVTHHSGWLPQMQRLRIIKKASVVKKKTAGNIKKKVKTQRSAWFFSLGAQQAGTKRNISAGPGVWGGGPSIGRVVHRKVAAAHLHFGGAAAYTVVPYSVAKHVPVLRPLSRLQGLFTATELPTTLSEWVKGLEMTNAILPKNADSYSLTWLY